VIPGRLQAGGTCWPYLHVSYKQGTCWPDPKALFRDRSDKQVMVAQVGDQFSNTSEPWVGPLKLAGSPMPGTFLIHKTGLTNSPSSKAAETLLLGGCSCCAWSSSRGLTQRSACATVHGAHPEDSPKEVHVLLCMELIQRTHPKKCMCCCAWSPSRGLTQRSACAAVHGAHPEDSPKEVV